MFSRLIAQPAVKRAIVVVLLIWGASCILLGMFFDMNLFGSTDLSGGVLFGFGIGLMLLGLSTARKFGEGFDFKLDASLAIVFIIFLASFLLRLAGASSARDANSREFLSGLSVEVIGALLTLYLLKPVERVASKTGEKTISVSELRTLTRQWMVQSQAAQQQNSDDPLSQSASAYLAGQASGLITAVGDLQRLIDTP